MAELKSLTSEEEIHYGPGKYWVFVNGRKLPGGPFSKEDANALVNAHNRKKIDLSDYSPGSN